MNSPHNFSGKSPRKEIQGPRPTPLQVRKDSHKIRKPQLNVSVPQQLSQSHHQHPPPVIIYTLSPKVYHAEPNEFMQLVQRLTGRKGTVIGQSSSSAVFDNNNNNNGAVSPAARFAATEYVEKSPKGKKACQDIDEITGLFPGILSPSPNSLPPHIFAPSSETTSPLISSKNYMDTFNDSFSPKIMAYSPSSSQDYFINFYDI